MVVTNYNLDIEKHLVLKRIEMLIQHRESILNEYFKNKPFVEDSIDLKESIESINKSYINVEKTIENLIYEEAKFLYKLLKEIG